MRKALFTLAVLLTGLMTLAAVTATSSMRVSAYKNPEMPNLTYQITVKDRNSSEIAGITSLYDISDEIKTNRTLSNAFKITIQSNLKADINVGLEFTPFINQKDTAQKMTVTYNMTAHTPKASGSSTYDNYQYRVTPSLKLYNADNSPISSIAVSSLGTAANLVMHIGDRNSVERRRYRNSWYGGSWGSYHFYIYPFPNTDQLTIPSFTDGDKVTATAFFNLSISNSDYNLMQANTDYLATVRLTINTV